MTKTYVLTGGTGFIGAYLTRRLVKNGHNVRVIDNDLRGSAARLDDIKGDFELVIADVRDENAMIKASQGADSMLHLAALNGTENFYNRPELVLDVGVRGMYGALAATKANNISEFVLASSSEAYQTPSIVPTSESVPLMIPDPWNPRYSYGGSKLISELMLSNFNQDVHTRAMIFRPHNVYGPDMGWEHVLPQFILRAKDQIQLHPTGKVPFHIQGDGTQTRSFIHIDDFVDGLCAILDKGLHRNVYHIGTEEELSITELVNTVFNYFGREAEINPGPEAIGGTPRRCPDITKLKSLGFSQKIRLEQGIASIAEWYAANSNKRPPKV